jgi:hypothetical protein
MFFHLLPRDFAIRLRSPIVLVYIYAKHRSEQGGLKFISQTHNEHPIFVIYSMDMAGGPVKTADG